VELRFITGSVEAKQTGQYVSEGAGPIVPNDRVLVCGDANPNRPAVTFPATTTTNSDSLGRVGRRQKGYALVWLDPHGVQAIEQVLSVHEDDQLAVVTPIYTGKAKPVHRHIIPHQKV
jgi:hypothetical protein